MTLNLVFELIILPNNLIIKISSRLCQDNFFFKGRRWEKEEPEKGE